MKQTKYYYIRCFEIEMDDIIKRETQELKNKAKVELFTIRNLASESHSQVELWFKYLDEINTKE